MIKPNTQKGQVIIINTLLFFALSTAIIFAITTPVISSFHITKSFSKSKEAFLLASSASSEALYKLNSNKTLSAVETLSLAQGDAIITTADTSDGKTISIESESDSYQRNYELEVSVGDGVSFNYGLQSGQGGFEIGNGSGIFGNAYSNGNIEGSGGAFITGSAISANISEPITIGSNTGVVDPSNQIIFGGNSSGIPQDISQSFTVGTTTPVSSIRILVKKTGTPWSDITMKITSDNSGKPSKTILTQGIIDNEVITSSFGYLTIPLSSTVSLAPETTYWIVFDTINFWGPTYSLGANNSVFTEGQVKLSVAGWKSNNGGIWTDSSPDTLDIYFDIYAGGSTGIIDGVNIGSGGVGDAWAHEVKDSNIAGTAYCQAGSGNGGKTCDTSRPDPVQQSWPVSDGNISEWKAIASAGGATTTKSFGWGTHSLGPVKIYGDLSINGGGTLNLGGHVYVTGDINVSGGATVRVNPSLGATSLILIADGTIKTLGGGDFEGSGENGSYILLITTSTCPNGDGCSGKSAIDISGGAGAVVLNAQKGTIKFSGGAGARQATANQITMAGGATVTYESGLANPNFTSGPSGAWNVSSWKEVE